MKASKDQEEKFLVTFADIISLFRKHKKIILSWAFAAGVLGMVFALLRPIRYEAEGTFREKGVKSNHVSTTSVVQLLSGAALSGAESEAASLMGSRRILKEVIDKLHLQGNLQASSDVETPSKLIKRNLGVEWRALFSRSPYPVLQELCCPLKIETLQFTGEVPLGLQIHLQSDGSYEVKGGKNGRLASSKGRLGELFSSEEFSLTLVPADPDVPLSSETYFLTLNPLHNTVQELCKVLKVEPSKLDKSLLAMKCVHRNRHLASEIVNATMKSYQNYLKNTHAEVAMNQLEYLNLRRDQLTGNLTRLMQRHADSLANGLSNSGFFDSNKEMDFLAQSQHEYKQKLLDNELEMKRLTQIKPGNLAYYDRYSSNEGDPAVINAILSDMRSLKQQRDALEVELQRKAVDHGINLQLTFEQQLDELKAVQQNLVELRDAVQQFQMGKWPEHSPITRDPRFLLKSWLERVQKAKDEKSPKLQEIQENFLNYLNNLERSFSVHERILQERLTHQQNPSGAFKGITLPVATDLYLGYSKQLVQMEGTIRQNLFFIHQIEDPLFEITSLSSGLDDDISRETIKKASELVLNLRDQNNQSPREQERIKEELTLQRTFLTLHLQQMVQLMELHKQLIGEKIFALENISLELIHQSISLLEKNLQDYLTSRLHNLQQERTLINRHLTDLQSEMAFLPQKWVSERLLTEEVETHQKIVEEIAKLVESKNISHNLDVIQSAPVDTAISPVHPLPPRVFLWGFLGFFLGGCLGLGYLFGKTLKKGIPVSAANLSLMGLHVSGRLEGSLNDREALRRLQSFADATPSVERDGAKLLLLMEGKGPHYAPELADLFAKRGSRVLILDLNVTDPQKISSPGLLQYLDGTISHLPVRKGKHGDWMAAGGSTPYLIEMIHAPAFAKMLDGLKDRYDWILAVSPIDPTSGEVESLLNLFPQAAVTLYEESVDDILPFARWQELHPDHKVTFMLCEENVSSISIPR